MLQYVQQLWDFQQFGAILYGRQFGELKAFPD